MRAPLLGLLLLSASAQAAEPCPAPLNVPLGKLRAELEKPAGLAGALEMLGFSATQFLEQCGTQKPQAALDLFVARLTGPAAKDQLVQLRLRCDRSTWAGVVALRWIGNSRYCRLGTPIQAEGSTESCAEGRLPFTFAPVQLVDGKQQSLAFTFSGGRCEGPLRSVDERVEYLHVVNGELRRVFSAPLKRGSYQSPSGASVGESLSASLSISDGGFPRELRMQEQTGCSGCVGHRRSTAFAFVDGGYAERLPRAPDVLSLPDLPAGSTRFLLVRHGHAFTNLKSPPPWPIDQLDHLTDAGVEQVSRLATALSETPLSAAFSSPAGRALDTARLLFPTAPTVDPRLRPMEIAKKADGGETDFKLYTDAWTKGTDPRIDGGESMRDVGDRVMRLVQERHRAAPGSTVLLVAHSEVTAAFLGEVRGIPPASRYPWSIPNASVSVVDLGRDGGAILMQGLVP